jgi:hypothetical protein
MTAAPTFDSQEAARSDEAPAPFRGRQLPFAPVALSVGERAAALRPLNHRPVPAPHPSSRRGQISVCESTGRHGPASFMTAAPRIQALAVTANRSGTTRQHPGGRGPGVPMGRRRRGRAGSSGLYCIPAVWRHRRRPLSRRLRVGGGRKDAAGGAASGPSHVVRGSSTTGPDRFVGHSPVRRRCASAQAKIFCLVSGGRPCELRTPRCRAKRRGNDDPPGKPRTPCRKADGNGFYGVFLLGSSNDQVQGNTIGTDVTGTQRLGNGFDGVFVQGGAGILVGGTAAGWMAFSGASVDGCLPLVVRPFWTLPPYELVRRGHYGIGFDVPILCGMPLGGDVWQ